MFARLRSSASLVFHEFYNMGNLDLWVHTFGECGKTRAVALTPAPWLDLPRPCGRTWCCGSPLCAARPAHILCCLRPRGMACVCVPTHASATICLHVEPRCLLPW